MQLRRLIGLFVSMSGVAAVAQDPPPVVPPPSIRVIPRADTFEYLPDASGFVRMGSLVRAVPQGKNVKVVARSGEEAQILVGVSEQREGAQPTLGVVYPVESFEGSLAVQVFQPTLTALSLAAGGTYYAEGAHDQWVLTTPPAGGAAESAIACSVGMLGEPRVLAAYLRYHNVKVPTLEWISPVVVVRCEEVKLPERGLWLSIAMSTADLGSDTLTPSWSLLRASSDQSSAGELKFADVAKDAEYVHLKLAGSLGRGDNLIYLTRGKASSPIPAQLRSEPSVPEAFAEEARALPCEPIAPEPPPEWQTEPLTPAQAPQLVGAAEVSRTPAVSTKQLGPVWDIPAAQRVDNPLVCRYIGGVTVPVVQPELDALSSHAGWIDHEVHRGGRLYEAEEKRRGTAEFLHEVTLRQVWQVQRHGIAILPDGATQLVEKVAARRCATVSVAVAGPAWVSCYPK